jgi:hypothetical protein
MLNILAQRVMQQTIPTKTISTFSMYNILDEKLVKKSLKALEYACGKDSLHLASLR